MHLLYLAVFQKIFFFHLNLFFMKFNKWITVLDSTVTCDDIKIEANILLFIEIVILVSLVNNIIVTVLWSKNICKCNCNSIDSSIPIATVRHPPANPQPFAPNWAIPLTGKQQQQFQSYSTAVVYSQKQPMNQQEHPFLTFSTDNNDESMNPNPVSPPNSTVDGIVN